jgi:dihydrofolate synthase/folylpolyglutamate synthase
MPAAWRDGLPLVLLFASLRPRTRRACFARSRACRQGLTMPIEGHECRSPEELAILAESMGFAASAKTGLADAMAALRKPARVLVFGSLYLAGEMLALNGPLPD